MLTIHRETFNFLKHADKDYDHELFVGEISLSNMLQLGVCVVNYHALYGTWTDHMQTVFKLLTILSPAAFGAGETQAQMQSLMPKISNMTVAEFFNSNLWSDDYARITGTKLKAEKEEDLQDTLEIYGSTIAAVSARGSKG